MRNFVGYSWNVWQNASMRVQLVYVGGFDPAAALRLGFKGPASRYEGPLATVSPNKMLKQKFRLSRSFGPELFFGAALAEAHPTGRFELIKHGFGGSRIVNASWSNKVPVAEPTNSAQAWEGLVAWSPGDWRFRATKLKASSRSCLLTGYCFLSIVLRGLPRPETNCNSTRARAREAGRLVCTRGS